jgi:CRISPR type III-A-associated protein Csm2
MNGGIIPTELIFEKEDPKELINRIKEQKIDESSSQIRKFFDKTKEIENETNTEKIKKHIAKLRILIEYAKNKGTIGTGFYNQITACLEYLMENPESEKYQKFIEFLEGIIAFSKKR